MIKKSDFWYNNGQKTGIIILITIIFSLQAIIFFVNFYPQKANTLSDKESIVFKKETDSLTALKKEKTPKIFPFNPNFITDYKGYVLGISSEELDRLYKFRKQGKYVNSAKEFQDITKISDSLLATIQPYFKFPKWVNQKQQLQKITRKKFIEVTDLNTATANDFRKINGISNNIAQRIVKYRAKLQGFSYPNQLYEVWGLKKNMANKILKHFKIQKKPTIEKLNINTATFKQVLRIVYIDYELCKKIFNYRDEVAELQSIEELKNIEGFPLQKFKKISLYLKAE